MKLAELKNTLREVVREVIQEELKDILLEAVKSNKQPVYEQKSYAPPVAQQASPQASPEDKQNIRENYMNVLGDMKAQFTSGHVPQGSGLQINGPVDTTSPNGKLPEGEVSMDQIMGIMNK